MRTPDGRHTTNYADTLITVADDTRATAAVAPPGGRGTVAELQHALLDGHDYELTSDDVIFTVHATRAGLPEAEWVAAREAYFVQGRPCLRTSPLAKSYGWGLHADAIGRVALVPMESPRYAELLADDAVRKVPAMRSSRSPR